MPNSRLQNYTATEIDSHYTLFCNNINEAIKKEIGLNTVNDSIHINTNWTPPTTYGLCNSEPIIPSYYINKENPCQEIDLFYELTKDIRNLKPLCKSQLDYIKTLDKEQVVKIINIYNECLYAVTNMLEKI